MGGRGSTDPSDGVGKTRDADPCGSVPAVVAMRLEIICIRKWNGSSAASQASARSPRRWSGTQDLVAPVMHSILACAIANLESVCHFLNFRVLILWKSKILLPAFDL
jgi:hypothetical protein